MLGAAGGGWELSGDVRGAWCLVHGTGAKMLEEARQWCCSALADSRTHEPQPRQDRPGEFNGVLQLPGPGNSGNSAGECLSLRVLLAYPAPADA